MEVGKDYPNTRTRSRGSSDGERNKLLGVIVDLLGNQTDASINYIVTQVNYTTTANNPPNYSVGDTLVQVSLIDPSNLGVIVDTVWFNSTTGSIISDPTPSEITKEGVVLTHTGSNASSIQIGDGAEIANVTTDNRLQIEEPLSNKWKIIKRSDDATKQFVWLDFGTVDQRVSTITVSSSSLGLTATKTFSYTLVGTKYRLDTTTLS